MNLLADKNVKQGEILQDEILVKIAAKVTLEIQGVVEEGGVTCEEGCHCHHCYKCSVDGHDLLSFKVLTTSYL